MTHAPEVLPAPDAEGPRVAASSPPRVAAAIESVRSRVVLARLLAVLGVVLVPLAVLVPVVAAKAALSGGEDPVTLWWARGAVGLLWTLVAGWALWRGAWVPRRWPWLSLLAVVPCSIVSSFTAPREAVGPQWALSVLDGRIPVVLCGILAALALSVLGRRWWIRTPHAGLGETPVEVPVRLDSPGSGRILVERDRLVLALNRGGSGGHVRHAMPLVDLDLAQPGEVGGHQPGTWPLPGGQPFRIRRGPVLRVVAGGQQWLLHVDDPVTLADLIRRRSVLARPLPTGPATVEDWHRLRTRAVRLTTTVREGSLARGFPALRLPIGTAVTMLGSLLVAEAAGRGIIDPGLLVVTAVALLIGLGLLGDWYRIRRILRTAEQNPLPPGSPTWGETRSDHAPLQHWQPWAVDVAHGRAR